MSAPPDRAALNRRRLPVAWLTVLTLAVCAWPTVEILRYASPRAWAGMAFAPFAVPDSTRPSLPGLGPRPAGRVIFIVPTGPAARAGLDSRDAVRAVQGIPLRDSARLAALERSARVGDRVRYTLERRGVLRDVDVVLTSCVTASGFRTRAVLYLALGLAFAAAGLFVFWKRPLDRRAVLFHGMCLCLAGSFIFGPALSIGDTARGLTAGYAVPISRYPFYGAALVFSFLFLSLLVHFTLVFPRERPWLLGRPHVVHWTYAAVALPTAMVIATLVGSTARLPVWAGAALALALAIGWLQVRRAGPRPGPRWWARPWELTIAAATLAFAAAWLAKRMPETLAAARALRLVVLALGVGLPLVGVFVVFFAMPVITVAVLIRGYRESGIEERQQIRWPLWGLVVSTAVTALITVFSIAVSALAGSSWMLRWQSTLEIVTAAAYVLIPVGFAVGILKYRLMDLDLVIRKTAVYGAVTSLMVILYFVLAGVLGGWIVQSLQVRSTWVTVVATLTVVAAFVPVRNRVQAVIDRRFFRTRYAAPESLSRLSQAMGAACEACGLGRAVADELARTLRPRSVAVLALNRDARTLEPVATLGITEERERELAAPRDASLLAVVPPQAVTVEAFGGPLAPVARAARARLAVPVRRQDELLGLVLLGPKLSDEDYDEHDVDYLGAAAGQLAIGLANLASPSERRELDEARVIQSGLLPRSLPSLPGFGIAAHWQPARQVAGDYYDVLALGGQRTAFCIADVTGKGMPAALLMSNLQSTVKAFAPVSESPRALCQRVNRIMAGNMGAGRFITFFYGVLDAERRTFAYSNAGHNPPLLLRRDGSSEALDRGGLLLGAFPEADYEQGEAPLEPGDRLLLYTDGLVEAEDPDRVLFGEARLLEVLRRHAAASAEEIQRRVLDAVAAHCRGEFQDDATLIVLAVG
jgi:hypothetical protein